MIPGHQHAVGGNPVAFRDHDDVTSNDLPTGNADTLAITKHERAGTGEVAERFERFFATSLLDDGDGYGDGGEAQQHEGFTKLSQHAVDHCRGDQQREHGLADDVDRYASRGTAIRGWQLVEPFPTKPLTSFGDAQPRREV